MNTIALNQTATYLTRHVQRWDRRVRLLTSVVWAPRVLMFGVGFGLVLAIVSRLRPWLLPEQIAISTALVCAALLVGSIGTIWLWPSSVPRLAQHFDYRFGLKERISTALEVLSSALPVPAELRDYQLRDAVGVAERVDVRAELPLRVRWGELIVLLLLGALLAYLLLLPNPQTDELLAQRDLQHTIDAQVEELENAIEQIASNPELSEAEQQALTDPLNEALDILQQDGISQQEAVAALAEAQQALNDLSDGMTSAQESAYQQAANEVAGSELTSDFAEALNDADLGQAADALEQLADDLSKEDMTQAEREELADRLDAAADALEATNPALAEKLREAAQALREGDIEAAQQALEEAANQLERQQEQLENSELAQTAQEAREQLQESQQQLAGVGQEEQSQSQQAGQQPSDAGEQSGQMQQQSSQQSQSGQMQQQSGSGQQSTGETEDEASAQGESLQGQGQEADESSEGSTSSSSSQGQAGNQSSQGETAQSGEVENGTGSLTAGDVEGGAGSNTTTGTTSSGETSAQPNETSAEGDFEAYTPENAPSTLGGESTDIVDVGGQADQAGDTVIQEGELGPNPAGESTLTYSGVMGNFSDIISDALESGRIPLDQRDVIHDYFSSLEQ